MVEWRKKLRSGRELIVEKASELNTKTPKPSRFQIAFLLALTVPAFFYRQYFVAFILMILVTVLSVLVNRFELGRFGIELATFSTVTMATLFPPRIAAALGFAYVVLQIFTGSTPGIYIIWVIPSYTAAGYIISTLDPSGIASLGIQVSITFQAIFATMTFFTSRDRLPKYLQYAAFNLVLNLLLFQSLAEPFLELVKA